MSAEEVFALFPGSAERMENKNAMARAQVLPNYGVARLSFQLAEYPTAKERFSGIDFMSITLFDGRATEISVAYTGYPKGPSWLNVDDFITKLSDAFALPSAKDWQTRGEFSKTLKCSGFEIRANSNRNGSISLSSNSYTETVRQRAAADEEKKRREFKP